MLTMNNCKSIKYIFQKKKKKKKKTKKEEEEETLILISGKVFLIKTFHELNLFFI